MLRGWLPAPSTYPPGPLFPHRARDVTSRALSAPRSRPSLADGPVPALMDFPAAFRPGHGTDPTIGSEGGVLSVAGPVEAHGHSRTLNIAESLRQSVSGHFLPIPAGFP